MFFLSAFYARASAQQPIVPQPAVRLQGDVEQMRIERAVARYAKAQYSSLTRGFDDSGQEFATPHAPTGPFRVAYRTREHTALLAQDAGAVLVRPPELGLCGSEAKAGCIQVLIRIGEPVISGDSATVWLYAFEGVYGAELDRQLLLKKNVYSWSVVRTIQMREALSGKR